MNEAYTDAELDILIECYFRDSARPMPFPAIAKKMGRENHNGLDEILWKVITGYNGNDPDGPRRADLTRTIGRKQHRAGLPWHHREDEALRSALAGEGQRRKPKCTIRYIAVVLARWPEEVARRWKEIKDPLNLGDGFGLGASK